MSHKKTLLTFVSILALFSAGCSNNQVEAESAGDVPLVHDVDVVVYGATSGGISAAAAAAREGKSVLLVEHMSYLGGLLGAGFSMFQDTPFREPLGGITGWWYDRTQKYGHAENLIPESRGPC